MKNHTAEIADFFNQLSLLTKSELPLPETLEQLGASYKKTSFRNLLNELSASTAKGKTLSEAMAEHPQVFKPFYVRMIALGERDGTLPEVLSELTRMSRLQYMLTNMVKEIMLYPVVTISIASLVLLFLTGFVFPEFRKIFIELLEGKPLPGLTQMVLELSFFVQNYFIFFAALYLIWVVFLIWLYLSRKHSAKLLLWLVRKFPFAEIIFYNFAMARFCSMWAIMIRRKVPVVEGFPVIADVMDFPEVEKSLRDISEKCRVGEDIKQCLKADPNISRLLVMVIENSKEENFPSELERLTELFRERGYYGYRRTALAWQTISIAGMFFVCATIILAIFIPFIVSLFN